MRLLHLTLESFRSYEKLSLDFMDGSHLFLGPNGGGKTNILEGISYLSQTRSCLKANVEDALRFGADFLKIRADIVSDAGDQRSLEFVFQVSPRRSSAFFMNDVRVALLDFIGVLPTIAFLPQALSLFTGPPADRRAFLDALITQLRPPYAAERLEYERILKQRGALLRAIAQSEAREEDLALWDERLAEVGARIALERRAVLETMNADFLACMRSLGESPDSAVLEYEQSWDGSDMRSLQEALLAARSRDTLLQSTTVGPHRDDWVCKTDGRDIAAFASRGQQRTAFLALLFVSAGLFARARNERPVILLDDVLSELDAEHQSALLSHFKDHQVLITGTHSVENLSHLTLWSVGGGGVKRMNSEK